MNFVEKVAKTKEEAVALALEELGTTEDKVKIEVLEEANTRGLLGLRNTSKVKVKVTVKEEISQQAVRFLREILVNMGISAQVEMFKKPDHIIMNIKGEDLGALIGRRGQTLDALQYLVNLAINKKAEERERIIIDVEGYRKRREEILRKMALQTAEKVKRQGKKEIMLPMSPQERRIIHLTLQDMDDIITYSEGEEPYRRVIISPQDK
ncbi:MAG TPA: RNA-binding cell elongation regulator Jag/EloR [Bacteroidales bacterium]|nr:RNA-binding cell elongation regulator Jag/EloR [Bacteroidales bacterium]